MTNPLPIHVTLGTHHGVLWVCYREPGESDRTFEERLQAMRSAFASAKKRRAS